MDKKELMGYLKDAYELEKQLYTLSQLKEEYEDTYEVLEDELKQPLCVEERFDGTANPNCRTSVTIDWTTADEFYEKKNTTYPFNKYESYREYQLNERSIRNIRKSWENTEEYRTLIENIDKQTKHNNLMGILQKISLVVAAFAVFKVFSILHQYYIFWRDLNLSEDLAPFAVAVLCGALIVLVSKLVFKYQKVASTDSYLKKCFANDLDSKQTWYQERMHVISTEYKEIILENILQTEKALEKIYSNNFIHPKYRNLVAVGQIYEYLDTNRCNELEGPNGAYNLFESELRQNIIILQLDEIIEQLDELNRAMYYVSSAINESNRILGNVSSQLGQISTSLSLIGSNTALTAYNTQCTSFNTELMRRYN